MRFAKTMRGLALLACSVLVWTMACAHRPLPPQSVPGRPQDTPLLAEIDRGERILAVAAGDCASSCEGLRIVLHGATALCTGASPQCDDGTQRAIAAKKSVRETCGRCP